MKQPPKPRKAYPWHDAFNALCYAVEYEAERLEETVADDDSPCSARELERERAAAFRHVLAIADTLRRWEW